MTDTLPETAPVKAIRIDPSLLERHLVGVNEVVPNPWNPNTMTDRTYEAVRESIRTYGFIDPVLGRPKGKKWQIINGEHRWRAAKDEGYEQIWLDSLGRMSDDSAKKLTIILNESTGEADIVKLSQLLADIRKGTADTAELLIGLPYTPAELDHLLSIGDVNWDDFKASGDDDSSLNNGKSGHQVVLNFDDHTYERWTTFTGMLMHELGETMTVELIVVDALKHAAEKL